jgi:hypothetical protein
MKNAVHLVNAFGNDFPSELKSNLDIYTYRILKSTLQPVQCSNFDAKIGVQTACIPSQSEPESEPEHSRYNSVPNSPEIERIEPEQPQQEEQNNSEQQQSKDIDITNIKNNEQQPEQQGDSTTQQDAA